MINSTTLDKLQKFDCLALAVSGGKDSMFLLNYWVENRASLPDFFVVNIDHNLRGEESKATWTAPRPGPHFLVRGILDSPLGIPLQAMLFFREAGGQRDQK